VTPVSLSSDSGPDSSGSKLDTVVMTYLQNKMGEIQKIGQKRGKKVSITSGKAVTTDSRA
jgi:hypothetical protein